MGHKRKPVPPSTWSIVSPGLAAIAGCILLFFALNGLIGVSRIARFNATSDLYIDAELEILSYKPGPNSSSDDPIPIKGIIHPGQIPVQTDDHCVSLLSFNESDFPIQMAPSEEKVKGRRIKVKYFSGDPSSRKWWYPPVIHRHYARDNEQFAEVIVFTAMTSLLVFGCFYYVYRCERALQKQSR